MNVAVDNYVNKCVAVLQLNYLWNLKVIYFLCVRKYYSSFDFFQVFNSIIASTKACGGPAFGQRVQFVDPCCTTCTGELNM